MDRARRLDDRARVLRGVRAFFDGEGFLEVETPTIVPSPGLDVHLDAFRLSDPARELYLATSPEYQMKRLLALGYARIYQITRAYRRDEVGALHNPEFSILEWYRANAGVEDVMRDTERLVEHVTGGVVTLGERRIDTRAPFYRVSVIDAFERFAETTETETLRLAEEDEERFFFLLVDRVEPALSKLDRPIFMVDYPATQASLARKKPSDSRVAERFELYLAGVELCNGFGELTDPKEQRARFVEDQRARRAANKPVYPIDERFIEALESGMPPAGGNALGLDRLAALACGTTDIRAVLAFGFDEL